MEDFEGVFFAAAPVELNLQLGNVRGAARSLSTIFRRKNTL